jgi:hypothetical protein
VANADLPLKVRTFSSVGLSPGVQLS